MAVVNQLPSANGSIKGFTTFKWFEDGVIDNSGVAGTIVNSSMQNGLTNLNTIATDKYLRLYQSNVSYGRALVTSENKIPQGSYDFALFHIIENVNKQNSEWFRTGLKMAINTDIPQELGRATIDEGTDFWVAVPLQLNDSNHYFVFGGTVDIKIDKIYLLKAKQ